MVVGIRAIGTSRARERGCTVVRFAREVLRYRSSARTADRTYTVRGAVTTSGSGSRCATARDVGILQ